MKLVFHPWISHLLVSSYPGIGILSISERVWLGQETVSEEFVSAPTTDEL